MHSNTAVQEPEPKKFCKVPEMKVQELHTARFLLINLSDFKGTKYTFKYILILNWAEGAFVAGLLPFRSFILPLQFEFT